MKHYLEWFESFVIAVVQVLLVVTIAMTLGMLAWLLVVEGFGRLTSTGSVPELQALVLRAFGGALLVLLGLELLESLKTFTITHESRLETILMVSTIAVTRHVILLDLAHASGSMLAGVGVLLASLVAGYALVRRSRPKWSELPLGPDHSG